MIVAGCDVGSLTAKAVILNEGKIISHAIIRTSPKPKESAEEVIKLALDRAGLSMRNIVCAVGTGYGKDHIPFADRRESEIVCAAKGARRIMPSVRTIIDIGGQDAKAIKIDESGNVTRYIYNDKCASGTGRFLEIVAELLEAKIEDLGDIALSSREPVSISNQCVIFAETEVISLVNEGKDMADIVNGLHHAMANRAASLARSIGVEKEVVMAGGVAKNSGMRRALGEALGVSLQELKVDPQIIGALGAAFLAEEVSKGTPQ